MNITIHTFIEREAQEMANQKEIIAKGKAMQNASNIYNITLNHERAALKRETKKYKRF